MLNLENRKIIITGAASGIGKAVSLKLAQQGSIVYAVDINKNELEKLKGEKYGEKIQTYVVDVSVPEQIKHFFIMLDQEEIFPDSLVNNAGIYLAKSILDYENNEIDRVFNTNIRSAVLFSKYFAKRMIIDKKNACIVNVSSVAGQEASSDAVYGLSKAALIGLTKSNALNFSPNIRVNAVAPGIVDTPMAHIITKERRESYREDELLNNPIQPEDVANTIIFLLSDASKHCTGAVFDINNGCYLR
ncbi:MAG: oxidoreductase [uncultured bacterium]|nr:MAG: oxidoreductase [uncultured bacterium]